MVWELEKSKGNEARKIVWEVAPFLRGRGLDLGAGDFKILPHATSVDNCHHNAFGYDIKPDVKVDTCENLDVFASQSMNFVFSSHLLEHIQDYKSALKEWWRVVNQEGHLILYLPHKNYYPNVGKPGANPDHKHDFLPQDIIAAMQELSGGWDLLECQERNNDDEYSMLLVFRKTHGSRKGFSYLMADSSPRALVCRFGAYGDLMQASSVFAGLKAQGFHVTLMASKPGVDVVTHDPNIDEVMLLDKDQVPNGDLTNFWSWQSKKYDRFVNLSESVEGTWLALPGRTQSAWSPLVRHRHLNFNYLEFQHQIAQVPHKPSVKFFPTLEEKIWAAKQRKKMGDFTVLWSLAGSSVHKTWAGLDNIIAALMLSYQDVHVVLCGGPEAALLEAGWENETRVHLTCGKWSIRQTLSFASLEADLIMGPETGVLNAVCCEVAPKVVFLSHSSRENLTRDWVNTTALQSKGTRCAGRDRDDVPTCHMLHYGFDRCTKDEETGTAQCQKDISVEEVYDAVAAYIPPNLRRST